VAFVGMILQGSEPHAMNSHLTIEKSFRWGDPPESGAFAHFSFSPIGFDSSGRRVFFYVDMFSSGRYGDGHLAVMENRNGEWKLIRELPVWIS
jgi:hypothetical protein